MSVYPERVKGQQGKKVFMFIKSEVTLFNGTF